MIQGKNIDKNVLSVISGTFDLSAAATETEVLLFNTQKDIKINSISLIYMEASSADAGTDINFGNIDAATTYGVTTSEVSKAAGYTKVIDGATLTSNIVLKGKPFIVANVGSKVGTGTVNVSVNYTVL